MAAFTIGHVTVEDDTVTVSEDGITTVFNSGDFY